MTVFRVIYQQYGGIGVNGGVLKPKMLKITGSCLVTRVISSNHYSDNDNEVSGENMKMNRYHFNSIVISYGDEFCDDVANLRQY